MFYINYCRIFAEYTNLIYMKKLNQISMRKIKHIIVFIFIATLPVILTSYLRFDITLLYFLAFIPILMLFNLAFRRKLSFKNYYTSRFNLFTVKYHQETAVEISPDLLYDKMKEVINDSKFKLVDSNSKEYEILAITSTTLWSWGENLYIDIKPIEEGSLMKICSSTWFQLYVWGKNEENCTIILNELEESLIV